MKNNPAVQFLLERVVVWLAESGRRDTEHLVEMIFSSFRCCSQQEITRILSHVTTVTLLLVLVTRLHMVKFKTFCWSFLDGLTVGSPPASHPESKRLFNFTFHSSFALQEVS